MATLPKPTRANAMALAVAVGLVYLLPAGLLSAYRVAAQAHDTSALKSRLSVHEILVTEKEDCPDEFEVNWY